MAKIVIDSDIHKAALDMLESDRFASLVNAHVAKALDQSSVPDYLAELNTRLDTVMERMDHYQRHGRLPE